MTLERPGHGEHRHEEHGEIERREQHQDPGAPAAVWKEPHLAASPPALLPPATPTAPSDARRHARPPPGVARPAPVEQHVGASHRTPGPEMAVTRSGERRRAEGR